MVKGLLVAAGLAISILAVFFSSTVYSQTIPIANMTSGNQSNIVQINPHSNLDPFQQFENQSYDIIPPIHHYNSSLSHPSRLHTLAKIQQPQVEVSNISNSPNTVTNISHPLAVNLNPGFTGLDEGTACGVCSPPDVQVAVGPNHVTEFVNVAGKIWTKQGTSVSTFSLYSFFTIGITHNIADPKILYDSQSGRWFASILDFSANTVVLAVSTSNDPTVSGWHIYNLTSFSNCPDQPILGISDDKIVLSSNEFTDNCSQTSSFVGAQYAVLNKAQAVAGTSVSSQYSTPDLSRFSIHPVQSLSSTSALYMISTDQSALNQIQLFSVTGTVPSATVSTSNIPISQIQEPIAGVQPGTFAIDTNDARILDAKWYQNKLWFSFDDSCTPSGDTQIRSCAHIALIDTSSNTMTQNMEFGSLGNYYYYPALGVDSSGNLVVIFGYSSSVTYPSLAVTTQATSDPANTLESPIILASGSAADASGRYGDYFGAASDPSVIKVWVAGEYHTSASWSTFIGNTTPSVLLADSVSIGDSLQMIHILACLPPLSGDWTISSSCTLTNTTTAPANVIVPSGSILTIPNGMRLNIDFTHYHLLVKSGGGVLIKSGGAIN